MIKVLQIYRTCFPVSNGGIEQVIRYIAKGGSSYGIETKILSLSDSNYSMHEENTEIIFSIKKLQIYLKKSI